MAIDTAEKRRSISGIWTGITIPGVTPNATKDQEWRQESGWGYPGILAGVPIIPPEPEPIPRWIEDVALPCDGVWAATSGIECTGRWTADTPVPCED